MTIPCVDIPTESWDTVETLICRLEAARRNNAPVIDSGAKQNAPDVASRRPNFPSLEPLKRAFDLQDPDARILIFALAPTARPKLGWLYREFQPGDTTGLPGVDLICELLQLKPGEAIAYRNRLAHDAPLVTQGLLSREQWRPYAPLRPTSRALGRVLGVRHDGTEIPGAVLVTTNRPEGGGKASRSQTTALLKQLVCPAHLVEQLRRIAQWPQHDERLVRWGIPVEHGPIVLFSGPSGTGKTMAARAMAECAGLPLFRVDMGMLVSKYIGDTPKNINQLFDQAMREDAILLFDEAEGLFGKRGKVEDARDRYANMEVGHLLSRIERFPGICLLTTNLREHIDSAFLRRIDIVLHFNLPTIEERVRLWQIYLGKLIPRDDTLPVELAKEPNLTGAQIASACRFAARHVARSHVGKNGRPSRQHVLEGLAEGVWCELRKSGTGAIRSNLGFLDEHLVDEGA